jgi:endonuclease YncB( thermonuclease family)
MDNNKEYTRKEIRELIYNSNNNFIDVKFGDFDKYGRPLVIIYKDGININNAMIVGGYAKKYNGGKKEDWED